MNKVINKARNNVLNQKKKYLFLTVLTITGIISGILYIFIISKEDKLLVKDTLSLFFNNISGNNLNYLKTFINSFISNFLYLLSIWILGISIVGIPIILILLFIKGFTFGFGISALIKNYGLKGIFLSLGYILSHNIILLITYILISFYAINFSIRLYRVLFLKKNINLSLIFKRYNRISLLCLIIIFICSLIETFLSPIIINLFL